MVKPLRVQSLIRRKVQYQEKGYNIDCNVEWLGLGGQPSGSSTVGEMLISFPFTELSWVMDVLVPVWNTYENY